MTEHAGISAVELTKRYEGIVAVDGCTLEASKGVASAVIGPNGAGKSTLFKLLAGTIAPTSGQVLVDGTDMTGARMWRYARRGVVRTFQEATTFPSMTAREAVMVGTYQHQRYSLVRSLIVPSRRERAAQETARTTAESLLEQVGLIDKSEVLSRELAYGEQRRLGIAVALAARPSYLLLDEPAAGLNERERRALAGVIAQITADGVGILLIEHHLDLVRETCATTSVMDRGRLIASGSTREVLASEAVRDVYLGDDEEAA
jgi:ABC-type branched-subunit amino acid transport system ATPase component